MEVSRKASGKAQQEVRDLINTFSRSEALYDESEKYMKKQEG